MGFSLICQRLLLLVALLCGVALPAGAAVAGPRSNILFILVDDMDYALFQHMPKLKLLLTDRGMEFQNSFVSLSVCCPSRASILRGQFAHNTTIFGNVFPNGGFLKVYQSGIEASTMATWLKQSGYRTGLVGKYMNQYPDPKVGPTYVPPGWSLWFVPNGGDMDLQYNYKINFNGTTQRYGEAAEDHLNDVLLRQAQRFIHEAAADPPHQPFFLMLTPTLPHLPAVAPPRYLKLYGNLKAPRTPSFNEPDMSDKPRWMRNLPPVSAWQQRKIDQRYVRLRRATHALDDMVESLVQALQASGQLDNTYIVFTSDNGVHMGQHRLATGKGRAYEEDIRVPLVVRGPGIPAGHRVTHLAANVDLAPTFAAIAGVTPPDFVDGRSLVPLFRSTPPARWRQALLLESQPIAPEKSFHGLRTATNRMFALYGNGDGEFYDMDVDPYQLDNRYDTMPTALKAALTKQARALRTAKGAALRAAEEVRAGR
ncbi:sulfatase family protein [Azohydromonas caseinilytica]|uniref:Sulfatase n=1 Tax=Azohydromonas caseinilytica TaxID=2728836 RepID=A0A848FEW2_9BURK|nr:sulfatase [Azohydromonas caseinilytica]NML18767.1 sulfatase [Azohydromonas caseinilytica]